MFMMDAWNHFNLLENIFTIYFKNVFWGNLKTHFFLQHHTNNYMYLHMGMCTNWFNITKQIFSQILSKFFHKYYPDFFTNIIAISFKSNSPVPVSWHWKNQLHSFCWSHFFCLSKNVSNFLGMVTKWVFKNVAQNVAQPIFFVKINT
jgi:hypothetical protein